MGLYESVVMPDVNFARSIRHRSRRQNQVDNTVPFDQRHGINVDHVLRLQPKLARNRKCSGVLGIEIEDRRSTCCTLPNDINLTGTGRGIHWPSGFAQGFTQAETTIAAHGQCQRCEDLAHEKDLGVLPIRHADGVLAFQRNAVAVITGLAQLDQINEDGLAIPNQRDRGPIPRRRDATSSVDGFIQRHRDVREDLRARSANFAFHVRTATSEGLDSHRDLGIANVRSQQLDQQIRSIAFAQTCNAHTTDIGKCNLAVGIDDEPRSDLHARRIHRLRDDSPCIRQKFRVVIHDDTHHIARSNGVARALAKQRTHFRRHALRCGLGQGTNQRKGNRSDLALGRPVRQIAEVVGQRTGSVIGFDVPHAWCNCACLQHHHRCKQTPLQKIRYSFQFQPPRKINFRHRQFRIRDKPYLNKTRTK
ncbi:hypothetical protein SAMN05443579_113112 [Variovorax sp. PDC80]|nr:hypothetical protein SAMN05443579_113112 [Variovorax sp. PDC80]